MTMRYALKEEKELFYNRMLAKYQGKSAFLDYYFKEIFENRELLQKYKNIFDI